MTPENSKVRRAVTSCSAVEASLKRLRTDWIDLYQLHRPDPATPIEETLRALDDLVRAGKVRFIGCSNLSAKQITEARDIAQRHGLAPFVTCQDEYSLLVRGIERENIPVMKSFGLGLLPYFPLASGLLTGKYRQGAPLPEGSRLAKNPRHAEEFVNERNMSRGHGARRIREKPRPHAAGTGDELARRQSDGVERHRRRQQAGAGRAECCGDRVDADR